MSVTPGGYTTVAPWIVTQDTPRLFDFIVKSSAESRRHRCPSRTAVSVTPRSGSETPCFSPSINGRLAAPACSATGFRR